ncbi:MAG TPA: glycosyltransferase [Candidatus Binataceae bacterium]|nr:glycosyltransferase [Candidatus Binataceae bacterium]
MPRVSVIIPVYNSEKTIAAAIDSVLGQTYRDFEIIAVDDGSADSSREILGRYQDRVKILAQKNRGPSAARNYGVRESAGEYLAFLDADDRWYPTMLATMVEVLDAASDCVLAYSDLSLIDSEGRPLDTTLVGDRGAPTVEDMLRQLWPIMPSAVVMRRRAFDRAGGFPEPLTSFEDVYFWLLVREIGPMLYVPEVLGEWRFAHFPNPLKAGGGQEFAGQMFDHMLRERYGVSGLTHVEARRRAPRSILGFIGLHALKEGDRARARRAFARAIEFDRYRVKNYLRYIRTFLPAPLASALGGKGGQKTD